MDLGFEGLINSVEKHWGSRVAKSASGMLIVTLACGVLIAVRQGVIEPLSDILGEGDRSRKVITYVLVFFGAAFAIALGWILSVAVRQFSQHRRAKRKLQRTVRFVEERMDHLTGLSLAAAESTFRTCETALGGVERSRASVLKMPDGDERSQLLASLDEAEHRLIEKRDALEVHLAKLR